jgi:hypothetical protein
MPIKSISLSLVMKFIALIALNLALLRAGPFLPEIPILFFVQVMLDIVLVQSIILGRPLRAFHYTFLVVGLVASIALTGLSYVIPPPGKWGSLCILRTLIGAYRRVTGDLRWGPGFDDVLARADRCVTSTLGLLLAWASGLWVARRQPRLPSRGRHIASFFQGALIGLGVFTAISFTLAILGSGSPAARRPVQYARLLGLVTCPFFGGLAVLLLKGQRDPEGPVNRP